MKAIVELRFRNVPRQVNEMKFVGVAQEGWKRRVQSRKIGHKASHEKKVFVDSSRKREHICVYLSIYTSGRANYVLGGCMRSGVAK